MPRLFCWAAPPCRTVKWWGFWPSGLRPPAVVGPNTAQYSCLIIVWAGCQYFAVNNSNLNKDKHAMQAEPHVVIGLPGLHFSPVRQAETAEDSPIKVLHRISHNQTLAEQFLALLGKENMAGSVIRAPRDQTSSRKKTSIGEKVKRQLDGLGSSSRRGPDHNTHCQKLFLSNAKAPASGQAVGRVGTNQASTQGTEKGDSREHTGQPCVLQRQVSIQSFHSSPLNNVSAKTVQSHFKIIDTPIQNLIDSLSLEATSPKLQNRRLYSEFAEATSNGNPGSSPKQPSGAELQRGMADARLITSRSLHIPITGLHGDGSLGQPSSLVYAMEQLQMLRENVEKLRATISNMEAMGQVRDAEDLLSGIKKVPQFSRKDSSEMKLFQENLKQMLAASSEESLLVELSKQGRECQTPKQEWEYHESYQISEQKQTAFAC